MMLIDIGDLQLDQTWNTRQAQLFHAIRNKIISGLWPIGGKLPSTRKLAQSLTLSRNTVSAAYEQLTAEGYLESRHRSGFYVAVQLPEQLRVAPALPVARVLAEPAFDENQSFAPGVPDLSAFPYHQWRLMLQRQLERRHLMGNQDVQGDAELRHALVHYLATSRAVRCRETQIIITSGAQQALSIAVMATLPHPETVLMEQPGYVQMSKVIQVLGHTIEPLPVYEKTGVDVDHVLNSAAKMVYLTPSHQYPMGTTLNTEQRIRLIEWASSRQRLIIEDDYDSEFQFAHRPYTSLQGLAAQMDKAGCVCYIGSFSKILFNGLRLGYLVVPEAWVERCLMLKNALTGDSPGHTQAAVAAMIQEGHLLRHIRKMRRLYQEKYKTICLAVRHHFGSRIEIISQPAGLHITLKWHAGLEEKCWCSRARKAGLIIRPLGDYEMTASPSRSWRGVVLGYGNTAIDKIETLIQALAETGPFPEK
ncbi:MocR-like pyridoxine biosynthesis transcription factor PdxR [Vibrio aerogenes]|nr:PLP-dependent aminotransferase family protein [Vibrio aerogenes]